MIELNLMQRLQIKDVTGVVKSQNRGSRDSWVATKHEGGFFGKTTYRPSSTDFSSLVIEEENGKTHKCRWTGYKPYMNPIEGDKIHCYIDRFRSIIVDYDILEYGERHERMLDRIRLKPLKPEQLEKFLERHKKKGR